MLSYKAVILLGNCVYVYLPVDLESKNYTTDDHNNVLNQLAKTLGGDFLYLESVQER